MKVVSQRNTSAVNHHPLSASPLLVFQPQRPFFWPDLDSHQERISPVQLLALVQFIKNCAPDREPDLLLLPIPQPPPTKERMRELLGQVLPACATAQNPESRSTTRRSSAQRRPPCGRFEGFESKGLIFSHWPSANNRPYRTIGIPFGAAPLLMRFLGGDNYNHLNALYPVLQRALAIHLFQLFISPNWLIPLYMSPRFASFGASGLLCLPWLALETTRQSLALSGT